MRGKLPTAQAGAGGAPQPEIDGLRARHLALARCEVEGPFGRTTITIDEAESPIAWLARRRGRDGRALIEPQQLRAGERLRADFTHAHLMPRITANWESPITRGRRSAGERDSNSAETAIAARQRVHQALDAVGPEMAGLLLDVCCFLKRLEDVERERAWPLRSAKVVLQLALDRLARHYGYAGQARGRANAVLRTWLAEDAEFGTETE